MMRPWTLSPITHKLKYKNIKSKEPSFCQITGIYAYQNEMELLKILCILLHKITLFKLHICTGICLSICVLIKTIMKIV